MSDYKITLDDGTEIEAPNAFECLSMALGYEDETCELEVTVEDGFKWTDKRVEQMERELKDMKRGQRRR